MLQPSSSKLALHAQVSPINVNEKLEPLQKAAAVPLLSSLSVIDHVVADDYAEDFVDVGEGEG